jgi:hypothetical protein
MGEGDTLHSLPRTCGRHKSGKINISDFNLMTHNKADAVNVIKFKYNS